jgi:CRP-like cAMP-binding protein
MKKRKKRGEYIYHQNDPVTHIYLLKRGEVKLAKETKLFEEDPNNLYMNRVKLMTAGLEGKQQQKYEVK